MVSVVYCTREHNEEHIKHIHKMFGHPKVEVIEYINEGDSLTKFYKKALKETKYDIVVFLHDDIIIETKQVAAKLVKLYENNPEYGVLGVAGSKHMAETGKWWENPKKMYGRVAHTHEGKSWLSAYSDDLGNAVEEVVNVDGVFFSVHKKRLKVDFDTNVKGFHFYDVDFSFRSYLSGVKVGVHTNIRINHMSIGITNEEWEQNRIEFAEKFKDKLPVNIKRVIRPNEKIKVLIGCLSFANLTGSELYTFELAKELIKQNCDVTICSTIGMPLAGMAKKLGIKLASIQEPPGFKLGDGKWHVNGPQGLVASQPNVLYNVEKVDFDVVHMNHKPVTEHLLRFYPNTPVICTIHSEVLDLEAPVISPEIKKYIAIRPEIKQYIVDNFGIDSNDVDVIYNPIDNSRFKIVKNNEKREKKRILSVSTIDYLRKNMLIDLINNSVIDDYELWIVGKKNGDDYLSELIKDKPNIKYFEATKNIEGFIHQVDETAGVLLGRVTIESWMCGKPSWIYDISSNGDIISKSLHQVPLDIDKFNSESVVKQIIGLYKEILE